MTHSRLGCLSFSVSWLLVPKEFWKKNLSLLAQNMASFKSYESTVTTHSLQDHVKTAFKFIQHNTCLVKYKMAHLTPYFPTCCLMCWFKYTYTLIRALQKYRASLDSTTSFHHWIQITVALAISINFTVLLCGVASCCHISPYLFLLLHHWTLSDYMIADMWHMWFPINSHLKASVCPYSPDGTAHETTNYSWRCGKLNAWKMRQNTLSKRECARWSSGCLWASIVALSINQSE